MGLQQLRAVRQLNGQTRFMAENESVGLSPQCPQRWEIVVHLAGSASLADARGCWPQPSLGWIEERANDIA